MMSDVYVGVALKMRVVFGGCGVGYLGLLSSLCKSLGAKRFDFRVGLGVVWDPVGKPVPEPYINLKPYKP